MSSKKKNSDQVILDRIVEDTWKESQPELKKSEFFELFAAEQILKDNDLSYEDLSEGIVGKGGDGGVDSIFLFIQGMLISEDTQSTKVPHGASLDVHIIQSKTSQKFGTVALKHFQDAFEDLFDIGVDIGDREKLYNSLIVSKAEKFREFYLALASRRPTVTITFHYASFGSEIHPDVSARADKLRNRVIEIYGNAQVHVNFLSARDLVVEFGRVRSTTRVLTVAHKFETDDKSFVCLAALPQYFNFISENGNIVKDIFDANVRDYQGNVAVNKEIRATLGNPESDDFWFLNNGVTILSPNATGGGNTISIDDPQIVNGLQTSTEIFSHFSANDGSINDHRKILVRVISESDEAARDRIIKATNSQSSIPAASLRSSDHVHRLIEEYFKSNDWYYDRKKNKYKNLGKPATRIVSIPYLAQAIMAGVQKKPNTARARPSTLINSDSEYHHIFNEKRSPQVFLNTAMLSRRIEAILREKFTDDEARRTINNIKWYVLAHFVDKNRKKKSEEDFLLSLTVPNVRTKDIENSIKSVHAEYVRLGATDQVSKGSELLKCILQ